MAQTLKILRNISRSLLASSLVACTCAALAQNVSTQALQMSKSIAPLTPSDQSASMHGYLYELTKGESTLFLYGTIEFNRASYNPINPAVLRAMKRSSMLLLEEDVTKNGVIARTISEIGMLPVGERMTAALPSSVQIDLKNTIVKLGLDATHLDRLQPWVVSLVLENQFNNRNGYLNTANPVYALIKQAKVNNMTVRELDDAARQLKLLSTQSPSEQLAQLVRTLKYINDGTALENLMQTVDKAWALGDQAALERYLQRDRLRSGASADFYQQKWLKERSERLAAVVEGVINSYDKTPMLVIEIKNLLGENGVLALLLKQGYTIKRFNE